MMYLLLPAIVIALLGGVESILSAMVADNMKGSKHDSNKELVGQGIANMAAPLLEESQRLERLLVRQQTLKWWSKPHFRSRAWCRRLAHLNVICTICIDDSACCHGTDFDVCGVEYE